MAKKQIKFEEISFDTLPEGKYTVDGPEVPFTRDPTDAERLIQDAGIQEQVFDALYGVKVQGLEIGEAAENMGKTVNRTSKELRWAGTHLRMEFKKKYGS